DTSPIANNEPPIIYAGTGEANYALQMFNTGDSSASRGGYGTGVLKSMDGGASWTLVSTGPWGVFRGNAISRIIVDPTNDGGATGPGQTLYLALVPPSGSISGPVDHYGVYKSTNAGLNWAKVSVGIQQVVPPLLPIPIRHVVTDLEYT